MNRPQSAPHSRVDDIISWFAASVMVAAGVVYALKLQDDRRKPDPERLLPRATPSQEPLTLQEIRANESGRGRKATAPFKIPWRGWKDVLVRTYHEAQNDRLLALAASVVFYSLVALFPAIAAGVSSYGLFANAAVIGKHLSIAADIVPAGTLDMFANEITRIAAKSDGRLTFGFLVGLGIALWSANAGMKAIFDALNIIYDEEEKRGLIWLNVVSLFFTFCAIAGASAGGRRGGGFSARARGLRAGRATTSRSSDFCAGRSCSCCSSSGLPCSIDTARAGGSRNGAG